LITAEDELSLRENGVIWIVRCKHCGQRIQGRRYTRIVIDSWASGKVVKTETTVSWEHPPKVRRWPFPYSGCEDAEGKDQFAEPEEHNGKS